MGRKRGYLLCKGYIPASADMYLPCKGYLKWEVPSIDVEMTAHLLGIPPLRYPLQGRYMFEKAGMYPLQTRYPMQRVQGWVIIQMDQ